MSAVESGDGHHGKQEVAEDFDWNPTYTLKPHHAIYNLRVKKAIEGKKDNYKTLSFLVYFIGQRLDFSGYFNDSVGTTINDLQKHQRSGTTLLDSLRQLPNEAVVHLDIKPDDFCKACPIGKHCTATNVRYPWGIYRDAARNEEKHISKIHSALVKNGYDEGKDFIFQTTTQVLYDFDGKTLNEVDNPRPQAIAFNSMLVKMGALRGIIQLI